MDAYLASLPEDRRAAMAKVRDVVRKNLPPGYEEGMQYGMIGWCVPLSRYPDTYNGQPLAVAALAAQKRHMAVYLMAVYADDGLRKWFTERYRASGKKLDMGQSCVRFSKIDQLPLDLIGEAIARVPVDDFIAMNERIHGGAKSKGAKKAAARTEATTGATGAATKSAATKSAATKSAAKKSAATKSAAKKSAAKKSAAKKSAAKKSAVKKGAVKKGAVKKGAAKKSAAKKSAAKKSAAKKGAAKKGAAKKGAGARAR